MGLRRAIRQAAAGAYEETSSRTSCEDCGRPYTAKDPMVQVSIAAGESRMRVHRACGQRVRDRRKAALRADLATADARLNRAAATGDRSGFDAAVAAADRARRGLQDLGH